MKFTTQATVVGMKGSKGELESGQKYDSTKVYVLVDMDESKGTMKGQSVAEYTFGDSTEFDKFKHLPFPITAQLELEMVTTGKVQRTLMVGLKPVEAAKKG